MADQEGESKADRGLFEFIDGSIYDGEVGQRDGRRVRHGKGVYSNQYERYSGDWDCDDMHGQGEYVFATGDRYVGGFSRNAFEGEGTYTWADGATYSGAWRAGKMHGEGLYVDSGGVRWEGTFFNGKFKSSRAFLILRAANAPPSAGPGAPATGR